MTDIMIDVETLGTAHNAALLEVAAIPFERTADSTFEELISSNSLYYSRHLSLSEMLQGVGYFTIDKDTVKWHARQRTEHLVQAAMTSEKLVDSLAALSAFVKRHIGNTGWVWSNSPRFDVAILQNAFNYVKLDFFVDFRRERDFRTLIATVLNGEYPPLPQGFKKHTALHDAAQQAVCVQKAYQRLKRLESNTAAIENVLTVAATELTGSANLPGYTLTGQNPVTDIPAIRNW